MVPRQELELLRRDQRQRSRASKGLRAHVLAQLSGVTLEAFALFALAGLGGADADDTGVDAAGDAVLLLDVDLGEVECLLVEREVVLDVSLGGAVDEVAHLEALDGLVLGAHLRAVKAANHVRVAPV